MTAKVAIQKVIDLDDPKELKTKLFALLNDIVPHLSQRKISTVFIKVNMCFIKGPETGITVDPRLVYWLCQWLSKRFKIKRIYVAEADATHLNANIAFDVLGWRKMFSDMHIVTLLNLSRDEMREIEFNGLYFKGRKVSEKMMSADLLISFAKLKTHDMQRITCVMKNQFGALPEKLKILYHPFLAEAIVDAVSIRPPDLCIVDGIIGHQGPGPVGGMPMPAGVLVAGTDAVATDHVCARLMRINPKSVPHIMLAKRQKVGTTRYQVLGTPIAKASNRFMTTPFWRRCLTHLREKLEIARAKRAGNEKT